MGPQSKISIAEAILLLLFGVIVDVLDFVPFVGTVASIGAFIILWIYFKIKGVKQLGNILVSAINMIPVVGALTPISAGIAITIAADWNPRLKKNLEKLQKVKSPVGGKPLKK